MSRTYAGFLFICKSCGKPHLLDSEKPYDGIRVPCIYNDWPNEYKEKDFHYWHGIFWDVVNIRIQAK